MSKQSFEVQNSSFKMDSDYLLDLETAGWLQRYTIRCHQITESETAIFLLRLSSTGGVR